MEKYKLKLTKLQEEIFNFFCIKTGESFNKREIAFFLEVSPTAISKAISKLEKEKLIIIKKKNNFNLHLVELNRDSEKVLDLKRAKNLKRIYESNIFKFLKDTFPGSTIILFGSYSKGEDILGSDIDIAIIGSKEKEINLSKFEHFLERDIVINFYDSFKGIHKHLKENILNGILIEGGIEL
jgi:predicted nucleotidyltransferase